MALNKIVASRNKKRTTVIPFPGVTDDGSTLSLDFTAMSASELTSRFTFSRSGTNATYVDADGYIKVASANAPRFNYHPITGAPLGLLVEETVSNLSTGGITQAGLRISYTQNTSETLDPMGTSTATKVTKTSADVGYAQVRALTGTATLTSFPSTYYSISVFVKRGDTDVTTSIEYNSAGDWGTSGSGGPNVVFIQRFSLTSSGCTIGTGTGNGLVSGSAFVQPFRDGWYRIGINIVAGSHGTPNSNPTFLIQHDGANGTYMYAFGPQVERYTAPNGDHSSYIPFQTTLGGTPTTRNWDVVSMTGTAFSSWFNSNEGTFWVEHSRRVNKVGIQRHALRCDYSDNPDPNRFIFIIAGPSAGIHHWYSSTNGSNYSAQITADLESNQQHRMAGSYGPGSGGRINFAINGSSVADTAAPVPVNVNRMRLLPQHNGLCYSKIKYWPRKLSNAELQYITSAGYVYQRSDLTSIDGSTINLKFTAPEYEGVLPNIMSFSRGSGATYLNDAGHVCGVDRSTTSNTIGTGSKTFILSAVSGVDRRYVAGNKVVVNNGVNSMSGTVTSYDDLSQSLVLSITASSGSGTFTSWTIGKDELRWEWNSTGTALEGVLIEGAKTNLLNWSEEFATSSGVNNNWTDTNITRTSTNNADPAGGASALQVTASSGNATIISTAAVTGNAERTFSVWMRRHSGSGNIQVTLNNGSTWTTQAITSSWVRYSFTSTSNSHRVGVRIVTSGDQIEVWGAQLETGKMTSYIPTPSFQNTRANDLLSVNFSYGGGNPYNSNYGSIVFDVGPRPNGEGVGYAFLYNDDSIISEGEGACPAVNVGGTLEFEFSSYTDSSVRQRSVFTYDTVNEIYNARLTDGTTINPLETLTSPGAFPNGANLEEIWIGSFDGDSGFVNTHIKEFVYYPTALLTSEIASLVGDVTV